MRSKEKYDSIPLNHIVHCDVCGRNLEKRFIRIRNLKENGNNGTCAYCDWLNVIKILFLILMDGLRKM